MSEEQYARLENMISQLITMVGNMQSEQLSMKEIMGNIQSEQLSMKETMGSVQSEQLSMKETIGSMQSDQLNMKESIGNMQLDLQAYKAETSKGFDRLGNQITDVAQSLDYLVYKNADHDREIFKLKHGRNAL